MKIWRIYTIDPTELLKEIVMWKAQTIDKIGKADPACGSQLERKWIINIYVPVKYWAHYKNFWQ